jgi:YegS/Rv2252/BmrU family lipid kinase
MPVAIIVNPIAGGMRAEGARRRLELAASWRDPAGGAAEVVVTERRGHARELARAAAARASLVVAWGGDGTVNEVASALAFGAVPMAIVPAGSGNGLATELNLPFDPRSALDFAARARPRRVDVGEINRQLFVNIAGIGFDARIAAEFSRPANVKRGLSAYASITGRMLLRYRAENYSIVADGVAVDARRALMVTFANSTQYGNGARIAPRASVDDGRLDLVVVRERSRVRTVIGVPRLFTGTADRFPGYATRQIAEAVVRSDRAMIFHADGEPFEGGTEIVVRVHPAALPLAIG